MANNYLQGTYEIQNWDKYLGEKKPRYLSSYEYEMFKWADRSKSVIAWSSEQVIVDYFNPIKQRKARYIVDIYIKFMDRNGKIHEEIIEIKPAAQVKAPKKGRKRPDVYQRECATYMVNAAKWEAAQRYADKRGWGFRIVTENSIFR